MDTKRIVITGMGTVNHLGLGVDRTFERLFNTHCSAEPITSWDTRNDPGIVIHRAYQIPDLDQANHDVYSQRDARTWPKLTKAAVIAVDEAVRQSGLSATNVASLISSIGGGSDMRMIVEQAWRDGKTKANPFHALGISYDYTAGVVACKYGFNGPSTVLDSACASGIYTIDYGIKSILAGDCEAAIVGGTDTMVDAYNVYFFQVLHALSRRDEDYISQPFSSTRDGFVLGEGAGVLVIETLEHALARDAVILAEIKSLGFFTETEHPTSPSETGVGAIQCATRALHRAGLNTSDIGFISAHATSTPLGDSVEYKAMNSLFPHAVITSNKGHIGHCMSGTGIIETIYGIKSLQTGRIPPTANFTGCDFEDRLEIAKSETATDAEYFIKNSYGFGGKCASMIVGKYENS